MILGLDEAGRGPVLGPLVLCGVCVTPAQLKRLIALGVRDSKTFGAGDRARARRSQLAAGIRQLASRVITAVASAEEVDRAVNGAGLNHLERRLAQTLIEAVPAARQVIIDGARIFQPLCALFSKLRAENHADRHHPVVAAASIVAKVTRDALLAELLSPYQTAFGPIHGGGYCNAPTASFLRAYHARHHCLPDKGIRRSWSWPPLRDLLDR